MAMMRDRLEVLKSFSCSRNVGGLLQKRVQDAIESRAWFGIWCSDLVTAPTRAGR